MDSADVDDSGSCFLQMKVTLFVEPTFLKNIFYYINHLKNKPVGPFKVNMYHHNRVYCTNKCMTGDFPALPEGDASS